MSIILEYWRSCSKEGGVKKVIIKIVFVIERVFRFVARLTTTNVAGGVIKTTGCSVNSGRREILLMAVISRSAPRLISFIVSPACLFAVLRDTTQLYALFKTQHPPPPASRSLRRGGNSPATSPSRNVVSNAVYGGCFLFLQFNMVRVVRCGGSFQANSKWGWNGGVNFAYLSAWELRNFLLLFLELPRIIPA